MKRADVLTRAAEAVADRGLNYGQPEDNFARIARRWNAHLQNVGDRELLQNVGDRELGPSDVAVMLTDVKLARLENSPEHVDSWIDVAGYAACGAEVSVPRKPFQLGVDNLYSKPGNDNGRAVEITSSLSDYLTTLSAANRHLCGNDEHASADALDISAAGYTFQVGDYVRSRSGDPDRYGRVLFRLDDKPMVLWDGEMKAQSCDDADLE
jgi:hypothetical protein